MRKLIISHDVYHVVRDIILATLGGFIGAVFGLLVSGKMIWTYAYILMMSYIIIIMVVLVLLKKYKEDEK